MQQTLYSSTQLLSQLPSIKRSRHNPPDRLACTASNDVSLGRLYKATLGWLFFARLEVIQHIIGLDVH